LRAVLGERNSCVYDAGRTFGTGAESRRCSRGQAQAPSFLTRAANDGSERVSLHRELGDPGCPREQRHLAPVQSFDFPSLKSTLSTRAATSSFIFSLSFM